MRGTCLTSPGPTSLKLVEHQRPAQWNLAAEQSEEHAASVNERVRIASPEAAVVDPLAKGVGGPWEYANDARDVRALP
jgi:hypothetical protein